MPEERLNELARRVQIILMDVDGVMTDGSIFWVPVADGLITETKATHAQDGAGIAFARKSGIKTGVITKRRSVSLQRRAEELKMDYIYNGCHEKALALEEICQKSGIPPSQICYIGDDLHDLPVLIRVGFPVAVANARDELKKRAAYVTERSGGNGAVREVIEVILKAQDKWQVTVESFLK